jgi:hypothetical protein
LSTRVRAAVLTAAVFCSMSAAGCRVPLVYEVKPGHAPRCEQGVCFEVVSFGSHRDHVGGWIQAPPGTLLVNAHMLADGTTPCQVDTMPVEWVTIDDTPTNRGPVDVGGAHGLVLGFPIEAWMGHSGYWRDMYVDLELQVAGQARCWRTRITTPEGNVAL